IGDQQCLVRGGRSDMKHAEALPLELVAVAIGAMQDGAAPALAQARNARQFVHEPEGEEQLLPGHLAEFGLHEEDLPAPARVEGAGVDEGYGRIGFQLRPRILDHGVGRRSILPEETMGGRGKTITGFAGIDDADGTPGPRKLHGGGKPSEAAADDDDIMLHGNRSPSNSWPSFAHGNRRRAPPASRLQNALRAVPPPRGMHPSERHSPPAPRDRRTFPCAVRWRAAAARPEPRIYLPWWSVRGRKRPSSRRHDPFRTARSPSRATRS